MPELRQNRYNKEWVILATERAKRPEELVVKREKRDVLHYSPNCPFCPGNEHLAPPAVLTVPSDNGAWKLRVVPNKFAALARDGEPTWKIERSHRSMNGVGLHDVVVETTDHALTTALLPEPQVVEILRAYKRRFDDASSDARVQHVTIFKNHGVSAGTSLEHPHSQIISTPVISHHVRNRMYEALRHYDEYGECIFCSTLQQEIEEGRRIVMVSRHFVALEPFASASPFYTHIMPKRHMASFGEITYQEMVDLAHVLRTVLAKLYVGLQDPDFNYTIPTASQENAGVKFYHWYINIIPRLTRVAGFEMGSGMFINTVPPESAAEFLRNVDAEQAAAATAD